jgi:hypothetical protein
VFLRDFDIFSTEPIATASPLDISKALREVPSPSMRTWPGCSQPPWRDL